MRQNAPSTVSTPSIEVSNSPVVLSTFQIDGHQLLIISLEDNAGKKISLNKLMINSKTYTEIDRFQVNEQDFAVIKVEESSSVDVDLLRLLTERELQIATLVASGQANKQIAHQLCISEWTVSTHLRRIFLKLGVDSRAAMVYRCAPIIQKLSDSSLTR